MPTFARGELKRVMYIHLLSEILPCDCYHYESRRSTEQGREREGRVSEFSLETHLMTWYISMKTVNGD